MNQENEVVECCPHCDREIALNWDVQNDGFQVFCPNCGNKMMLCSMCYGDCDWSMETKSCKMQKKRYFCDGHSEECEVNIPIESVNWINEKVGFCDSCFKQFQSKPQSVKAYCEKVSMHSNIEIKEFICKALTT